METISRVFFHELGHFVAKEINSKFYKSPQPASIRIFPCPQNQDYYCGEINMNKPENYAGEAVPKERLAIYIAATTYGCIFQGIYENISLREAQDKNGGNDLKDWAENLSNHKIDNRSIHQIELNYYESLKTNNALAGFLLLNPEDYLIEDTDRCFNISLALLRKKIEPIINQHYQNYHVFIEKMNAEIYYSEN